MLSIKQTNINKSMQKSQFQNKLETLNQTRERPSGKGDRVLW